MSQRSAWRRALVGAVCVGLVAGSGLGCGVGPEEDYEDFRDRSEHQRARVVDEEPDDRSELQDLSGRWLLNSLLFGGIEVGLRVVFEAKAGEADPPREYNVKVWLESQPDDDPPLVNSETSVDDEGRFVLVADPLDLPGEVLNRVDPIQAIVVMNSRTLSGDVWCGTAEGQVTRPLTLDLTDSTFSARRDDDDKARLTLEDVPFHCPDEVPAPPEEEEEPTPPVEEIERPESPDLSGLTSTYRDLSGDWVLTARIAGLGIPLQLWLSLRSVPGSEGGSLDGAVRTLSAPLGEPALATFTTQVDAEGRFEIWLPDFVTYVGRLEIRADILLAASSLPESGEVGFCGEAAGQVRAPAAFATDLAGSTYAAVPFVPGEGAPAGAPDLCPGGE